MATEKKQSLFGGAAVLAVGVVIVKIIGALFKIPLAHILGETGNADFNNAYNIYAVLLTISTAGLPVALSKMISEAKTLGRERQARRVLKVSFAAFLTLGVLSFVIMWFGNEKCAALLNNPNAAYGIKALAPGVVCVGCLAAFRGFAQGSFRMTPTAVSQIIEALCKLMLGLALSMWLLRIGQPDYIAAAGAIAGVTAGTILSLVYMAIDYLRHRPALRRGESCAPDRAILRRLLALAIPITLSSSMVSLITLIDTKLVQGRLHGAAQVVLHAGLGLPDGVLDALGLGRAVGLDDRLPCAQEGCAAVLLAVHLVLQVCHTALEQQVSQLAAEVCEEHLLQHAQQHFCHALGQLEDDVAGEAVAHHDVEIARKDIASLGVARKAWHLLGHERMRLDREVVALLLLLADVEHRHTRTLDAQHRLGVNRADQAVLVQHFGLAVDVQTHVQQ